MSPNGVSEGVMQVVVHIPLFLTLCHPLGLYGCLETACRLVQFLGTVSLLRPL